MLNSGKKNVIISVVSDLVTDQRVNRAAMSLHNNGMNVILVGRKMHQSLDLKKRPYMTKRFNFWFNKGPMFYASYNIRLFFFLLFSKADVFISNDLDTLLANYVAARLKGAALIYDSHEYFTEVPELINRPLVQSFWLRIERWIFPKLKFVMTVNNSIAEIYAEKYNVPVKVVRNLPVGADILKPAKQRSEFGIPENAKVFLFQGAGINIDRGGEEAIEAISMIDNAVLLFIGGGDVIEKLKSLVSVKGINDRVFFIPKKPMNELNYYTRMADFGLTLDKPTNLNYKFSLPNKLFDYIQAHIPILATDLAEVKNIIEKYDIGLVSASYDSHSVSCAMKEMISDENRIARWKKNLSIAASELCWEKEENKFLEIFSNATGN
jgi:glycosyltransferase involved in cell wall biosynthesis